MNKPQRTANKHPTAEEIVSSWANALATSAATDEVPPGWLKMSEIAALLGKSESHMAKLIRRAADDGRCDTAMYRVQCGQRVMALRHYRLK